MNSLRSKSLSHSILCSQYLARNLIHHKVLSQLCVIKSSQTGCGEQCCEKGGGRFRLFRAGGITPGVGPEGRPALTPKERRGGGNESRARNERTARSTVEGRGSTLRQLVMNMNIAASPISLPALPTT